MPHSAPRVTSGIVSVQRTATRVRIINDILNMIRGEKGAKLERLPSEPMLAKQLAVSRPSLREALSVLETVGVVEIRRGSGVYVKDPSAAGLDQSYSISGRQTISVDEARQLNSVLHDVRVAVEPMAAGLAAQHATKKQLAVIRSHLFRLIDAARLPDLVAAAHADVAFHAAIAVASGNSTLITLLRAIEQPLTQARELRLGAFWDEQFVISTHLAIFEAIAARDCALATKAMMRHLRDVNRFSERSKQRRKTTKV
jgi:GntR family transcriptional repressor for pyruvate dehydrogenase complex